MNIIFQVCFGVGLGYAVISFLLGQLLGGLTGGNADADAGFDTDAGFDADAGVDFDAGFDTDLSADFHIDVSAGADAGADTSVGHGAAAVSPFKPTVIAAFLVVFGGAGMILLPGSGAYIAATIAGTVGLVAGGAVYRLYAFLYSRQNTSAVAKQSLIGSGARVSEFIPQGKYGKITYYVNGNTYTAPAKSDGGEEIKRGADVEIVAIVKSTYFVRERPPGPTTGGVLAGRTERGKASVKTGNEN